MLPRCVEFYRRRPWRGFAALLLLAVTPKCLVCLAAWIGLGALLGLGGPELCGGPAGDSTKVRMVVVAVFLMVTFLLAGLGCRVIWRRCRCRWSDR